jgi:regulator of sigma E protease
VHSNRVGTWEELELALATAPRANLDLTVLRNGDTVNLHLEPPPSSEPVDAATLGFKFSLPRTVVGEVNPGSPAERAGLKQGDEILAVRAPKQTGNTYNEILNIISEHKGVPLEFDVRRAATSAGAPQQMKITIVPIEEEGRAIIGFVPDVPVDVKTFGIVGAFSQAMRRAYHMTALTFKIIGRIFTGSASVKTLSGPIEIARISGKAAQTGSIEVFLGFLGLVSLQLGVFNLLPIPILDGGVIALLLVEGIIGRDLSLRLKEKIVQVGFVFLILLMGFVVFNDLSKIFDFDRLFR